jgi:hypothetical protein
MIARVCGTSLLKILDPDVWIISTQSPFHESNNCVSVVSGKTIAQCTSSICFNILHSSLAEKIPNLRHGI